MNRQSILKVFSPDRRRSAGKRAGLGRPYESALFTLAVVAGNRGFLAIGNWRLELPLWYNGSGFHTDVSGSQDKMDLQLRVVCTICMLLFVLLFGVVADVRAEPFMGLGLDGAPMVLIPGGTFSMGTAQEDIPNIYAEAKRQNPYAERSWFEAEARHKVQLHDFFIDQYEVTNAQYRRFVAETGHPAPKGIAIVDGREVHDFEPWRDPRFNGDEQAVVGVTWYDAMAYAAWAGKRLPTEAEWERAARGGLIDRVYPWGNTVTHDRANYRGTGGKDSWLDRPAPVGQFAANGFGLYDMGGNVWEWCLDAFQDFYPQSPLVDPVAGGTVESILENYRQIETLRVLRGGSWEHPARKLRVAYRRHFPHSYTRWVIGLRFSYL